MQGNVRSIDALEGLRQAVLELARRFDAAAFDLRTETARALEWVAVEAPRYWKAEAALAERRLQEALDNLANMQATYGGRDKPAATEAKQRVIQFRRRAELCQQRLAACKGWAAEVGHSVDLLVAAAAGLQQHAEATLPSGAATLQRWIEALDRYAETPPPTAPAAPAASAAPAALRGEEGTR